MAYNDKLERLQKLGKLEKKVVTLRMLAIVFLVVTIAGLAYQIRNGNYHPMSIGVYILGIVAAIGTLQRKLYGWYVAMVFLAVSFIRALFVQWNNIRPVIEKGDQELLLKAAVPALIYVGVFILIFVYLIRNRHLYSK